MNLHLIKRTYKRFIQLEIGKDCEYNISHNEEGITYFTASFIKEPLRKNELYLITTLDNKGVLMLSFVFGRIRDLKKVMNELNDFNSNATLAKAYLNESSNLVISYTYLNCFNEVYLFDKLKEGFDDFFLMNNIYLLQPLLKKAI